jgi:hypothetical protein
MAKKTMLLILIVMIGLVLVAPAVAAGQEPVGAKLSLWPGQTPTTFPAGEPFHVAHGWAFSPPDDVPGPGLSFGLTLDGVPQEVDFVWRTSTPIPGEGPGLSWMWVYNFPDGLTGSHTFTGQWFASCLYLARLGLDPESCSSPNEIVLFSTNTAEVTFVAP